MFRVRVDDELLDIDADGIFAAMKMARIVRPGAVVVSDTTAGRYDLKEGEDTAIYTEDRVTHWTRPGMTGEVVETEIFRESGRVSHVLWSGSEDAVAYMAADLIRVTKIN